MQLEGSVVVVTGGAAGIGEALVDACVRERARAVVVADRDEAAATAVAARLGGTTAVIGRGCDVASQDAVHALVAFTEVRFGRIDLFCSNAGIMIDGGLELPSDAWSKSWSVNVMAHVFAAQAALPGMLSRGGGHFLHTASAAGLLLAPGAAVYTATKHAAVGFAEWLSVVYGDRGIGVHVLCPGAVDTKMLSDSLAGGNDGMRRIAATSEVLGPAAVADTVIAALKEDRFLILPHSDTLKQTQRKWSDPDRWLAGMRRFLRG